MIFQPELGSFFPEKSTKSCNRRYSKVLFIFDLDCELFRSYFETLKKALSSRLLSFKGLTSKLLIFETLFLVESKSRCFRLGFHLFAESTVKSQTFLTSKLRF